MDAQQTLHRRKSSNDTDESTVITPPAVPPPDSPTVALRGKSNGLNGHTLPPHRLTVPQSPRNRVYSTPAAHGRSMSTTPALVPSLESPIDPNFAFGRQPGSFYGPPMSPSSPLRPSFQLGPTPLGRGHSRIRSVSAFAPPSPSPLSASFPTSASANDALSSSTPSAHVFPTSNSAPEGSTHPLLPGPLPKHGGRHSRLHSRNLSVFFPRPGSLPHTAIAEDGTQSGDEDEDGEAPVSDMPSAEPSVNWRSNRRASSLQQPPTPLGVGFTFGGRPSRSSGISSDENTNGNLPVPPPMVAPSLSSSSTSSVSSRRGHHHKHSLSHNFFPFLEPGVNRHITTAEELHTQPTPTPVSPWTKLPAAVSDQDDSKLHPGRDVSPSTSPVETMSAGKNFASGEQPAGLGAEGADAGIAVSASVAAFGQFVIGSWLWVVGQQVGSLGCTGLGYWVVFDALGVVIGNVIPRSGMEGEKDKVRRSYGNARFETVLMFAQAVYLMFSSVYVCKETVEHMLLSVEPSSEKHHHHYHASDDDGVLGIQFPLFLLFISFFSLAGTAVLYGNHTKLVNVTDTRIPSFSTLIRSLLTTTQWMYNEPPPTTRMGLVLSNPYVASPLFFCLAILLVALCVPSSQHEACDLILAGIITIVTFNIAYRACSILGAVLLQTGPPRHPGGRMESFLRAMKEVEKHPQVLHLPPPHIWQLMPAMADKAVVYAGKKSRQVDPLIVTVELHVRHDLGDDEVLKLTRWTWERCMLALGGTVSWEDLGRGTAGRGEGPEVTVGVVRG
ncbi:hypothetical protein AX15_000603 [Amanita polypyramis BW_CC]|nr:hypothetical protein AX15_000603 [Amanita polypyramis BW_CC]